MTFSPTRLVLEIFTLKDDQKPRKTPILEGVSERTAFLSRRTSPDEARAFLINVGKEKNIPSKLSKFGQTAWFLRK